MPDGSLRLYAFVINPSTRKELHLTGIAEQPKRAWVLETGAAVQCKSAGSWIDFRLPDAVPDSRITAVLFELPRPARLQCGRLSPFVMWKATCARKLSRN